MLINDFWADLRRKLKKKIVKVREMQNVRHSFRSEKFLHHCVQRVGKPRKTYLVW
jgi:hypothetical protein